MAWDPSEHQRGLPRFVKPEHRARLRAALEQPRVGKKYRLAHRGPELFGRDVATIFPRAITHADLECELHRHGAPEDCCVFIDRDMTAAAFTLHEAISTLVFADDAALISCIPGRLALFTDEAPGDQWLLSVRDR